MVERYVFLFLGEDQVQKKSKIDSIKDNYLDKDLKDIDFELVYSEDKGLTPPRFDEILSYFPSSESKKRIVLIKNIESLNQNNRSILFKHLKSPAKSVLLILDSDKLDSNDTFIKELSPFVKVNSFRKTKKLGVFDLTQAIVSRQTTKSLKILNVLLNEREKPHSILGALFWQWDNTKNSLSLEKFRKGLKILLDTDIRIKTGKIEEDLALEMAIIRLSYLS
ncbi:MAG: hypothetical protein ABIA97_01285 [Candidatus Omnitrophota bacterium]